MNERLIRLLRIINLIQGKPGIIGRELAERCETTDRTIYRDLELLSSFVPFTSLGHGKGYSFVGSFSMYPLNFTEQEAFVLSMLPSVIDQVKPLLPPGFDAAYEKIMATHHKEKSQHASVVQQVADVIQMGTPVGRDEGSNDLFPIIQAILSQTSLKAVYHSQGRNKQTERMIDPYFLVPREQRFYLIGYCHQAGEIRTFRVSRFLNIDVTEKQFDKGNFSIRQYMKNTFSIERGQEQIRFKVRFSPVVARYIQEEEWFVEPRIKPQTDGSLLFEVTLNHDREFLQWVNSYGPDAEILEPRKYRDAMKEKLERWRGMYE
ncbi:putative DNA-binding transcriptional regulator YafY [Paenibacillus endophyticus]|uniref:Putative DNA-binding transcriptional regulator YafY n=1 Tax=Paenibacillus endophyticus TaxID=1294268 RepID=A0A7W5GDU2_9BACL|nr:transcriptional regulator [Paenibacillus endophyticus]MBB3155457.1 putative DNA-binding transcriptional regulator YafY [Paenibacillus endophyticus]